MDSFEQTRKQGKRRYSSDPTSRPSKAIKREISALGIFQSNEQDVEEDTGRKLTFLTLAGEIRNIIYNYILLNEETRSVSLGYDPAGRRRTLRNSCNPSNTGRQYFALTQVCRTVRAEFRPSWLATRQVTVPLTFINEYLTAFALPDACDDRQVGNMLILDIHFPLGRLVDVLPLIQITHTPFEVYPPYLRAPVLARLLYDYDDWRHLADEKHILSLYLSRVLHNEDTFEEYSETIFIIRLSEELGRTWDAGDAMGMTRMLGKLPIWNESYTDQEDDETCCLRGSGATVYFTSEQWRSGEFRDSRGAVMSIDDVMMTT